MMGAFGASLTDADLTALVAYLHTFEKKATPKAAPKSVPVPKAAPAPKPAAEPSGAPAAKVPSPSAVAPSAKANEHHDDSEAAKSGSEEAVDAEEPSLDTTPAAEDTTANAPESESEVAVVEAEDLVQAERVVYPRPDVDLDEGSKLYQGLCATCHGRKGNGRGPAFRFMDPAPRDFTMGLYKFTSTPLGQPATQEDLFRVISRGMPGSAMPAWSGLSREDRWQLVYFLQSLSPRSDGDEPEPFVVPAHPIRTAASVARGAEAYNVYGCAACHGTTGNGTGTKMKDASGNWIKPADLTRSDRFKGGAEPGDIYRTLTAGIEGTPMPSFAHVPEADRWALVHWIEASQAGATPL